MTDLKGKVVIITGASSGIGAATARRFARDGARVALAARRLERLTNLAEQVERLGGEPLTIQADVCKDEDIRRIAEAAMDHWGKIDILVNNAGIANDRYLLRFTSARIHQEIQTNLVAVIECSRVVLPAMLRQRSGHIINVASIAGLVAVPGSTVYSATKFGVRGFSDALRRELHGSGVHVSCFCPGFTPSELNPDLAANANGVPGAPGRPGMMPIDFVANQLVHLASHPRRLLIIPRPWIPLLWLVRIFPGAVDDILPRIIQKRMNNK